MDHHAVSIYHAVAIARRSAILPLGDPAKLHTGEALFQEALENRGYHLLAIPRGAFVGASPRTGDI